MKGTYTVRGPLPGIKSFTTSGNLSASMAVQLAKPFVAAWRESVQENPITKDRQPSPRPKTITISIRL